MALGLVRIWNMQQCALFKLIYSTYGALFGHYHSKVNNLSNPAHWSIKESSSPWEKYRSLSNKRRWLCCPTLTHQKKKSSWPASQLPSSLSSTEGPQRAPSTAEFTVYFRNRSIADQKSLQLRVRTAEKIVRTNTTHFTISQTAARTVPEHPLQQLLPSGGQVLLHPPWPQCWPIPTHSFWTNHKLLNPSQYLQKQSKNSNSLYSLTLWYS